MNKKRTLQLLKTGADTVASGCPFCMTMLTDGLKAEEREEVRQLDVAEILAEGSSFTPWWPTPRSEPERLGKSLPEHALRRVSRFRERLLSKVRASDSSL
ncbi:MAG: hypothetical protein R3B99_13205 [Polyangiales bacterium]